MTGAVEGREPSARGRLEGKVALVSAAAHGIGEAVARRFAREGARLSVADLDGTALGALADELSAAGAAVEATAGDASDPGFVGRWVAGAVEQYGRIDVLYNGVGVSRPGLIGEVTDDDWRFQQRTTLDTVFYATRAVLPYMARQGSGSIVSMSSGAGIGGHYGLGAYGAAKAAVINLMETVAMEYGPSGVRANAVTPGPTATAPMLAWVEQQPGGEAAHARELDLQRLSRPEEVASAVLFLASDEASNVTGIVLRSNIRAAAKRPL
jgi:meso-butanediol dehydrogenase / (S,S)-butanediol dehydrogenase / diacetyl reductase